MNKLLMIIVLIAIAVGAYLLVIRGRVQPPHADIFPPDAVAYCGIQGGRELITDIAHSSFWEKLKRIESLNAVRAEAQEKIENTSGVTPAYDRLAALIGDCSGIAVYGEKSSFGRSVIAAVKTGDVDSRLMRYLRQNLIGKEEEDYRGIRLHSFHIPEPVEMEGVFAELPGLCLIAGAKGDASKLIKASLDLKSGGKGKTLSADSKFREGMGSPLKKAGRLLLCCYVDAASLRREFKNIDALLQNSSGSTKIGPVAGAIQERLMCNSMGGYLYRDHGFAARIKLRPAQSDKSLESQPGQGLTLLSLAPGGTVFLTAATLGDMRQSWKQLKEADSRIAGFLEGCGISVERDILPWLGKEMSLQLSDISVGGLFPLVRAQLILAASDRAKAEDSMGKLMQRLAKPQGGWSFLSPQIKTEEYFGEKITCMSYPIPGFSPSFAVIGNRVIIGLDRASVAEIVEVFKGKRSSILSDPTFMEVRRLAPRRINQINYVDGKKAIEEAVGVAQWFLNIKKLAATAATAEQKEDGDKNWERMEADLPRIIEALKVFQAGMTTYTIHSDYIDHVMVLRVGI